MKIISSPKIMAAASWDWIRRGKSVGFVPTMGALHEGHASLLERARRENDVVVASIFVNPSQFGPKEDLSRYPRPFKSDAALCRRAGVDVLFHPSADALYGRNFQTWVTVEEVSKPLCGVFRPGHFRGVATVVLKLFNIVAPARAYFGMKDFQQLRVVEKMAEDLNLPVKIRRCPTVREKDGLALSSRNAYLSPEERRAAPVLARALRAAGEVIKSRPTASSSEIAAAARRVLKKIPGARVQYFSVVDPDTLLPLPRVRGRALAAAAVVLGRTRLIDNGLFGN